MPLRSWQPRGPVRPQRSQIRRCLIQLQQRPLSSKQKARQEALMGVRLKE